MRVVDCINACTRAVHNEVVVYAISTSHLISEDQDYICTSHQIQRKEEESCNQLSVCAISHETSLRRCDILSQIFQIHASSYAEVKCMWQRPH